MKKSILGLLVGMAFCFSSLALEIQTASILVTGTIQLAVSPSILTQPVSQSNASSSNLTFWVQAAGTAPLSYQWYSSNGILSGITTTNLTTNYTTTTNGFWVTAGNFFGSVTSSTAEGVWTNVVSSLTAGMYEYWSFDDATIDQTGRVSSTVLTMNGNPYTAGGFITNALGFTNSTADFFSLADNATFSASESRTFALWYMPSNVSVSRGIAAKGGVSPTNTEWIALLSSSGPKTYVQIFTNGLGYELNITSPAPSISNWMFLVVRIDVDTATTYARAGTITNLGAWISTNVLPMDSTAALWVGKAQSAGGVSRIDEFMWATQALSDSVITNLWQKFTNGVGYPFP